MKIHELVVEMKMLERRLTLYEEKYGVLSKDFYQTLMNAQLEHYDEFDETRTPAGEWSSPALNLLRPVFDRAADTPSLTCLLCKL